MLIGENFTSLIQRLKMQESKNELIKKISACTHLILCTGVEKISV